MQNFISYHSEVRKDVTEPRALKCFASILVKNECKSCFLLRRERGCIRSENRQFSNKRLCYKYGGGREGGRGWLSLCLCIAVKLDLGDN